MRHKPNRSYLTGSAILAAFAGLAFRSWAVYWVALAALVRLNLLGSNISLTGDRR